MTIFTLKNKRHMPTWLAAILAFIVKMISLTYRVSFDDPDGWFSQESPSPWPVVLTLWHNRILFTASFVRKSLLQRMSVLIRNREVDKRNPGHRFLLVIGLPEFHNLLLRQRGPALPVIRYDHEKTS